MLLVNPVILVLQIPLPQYGCAAQKEIIHELEIICCESPI
jgi:hypothetical protein